MVTVMTIKTLLKDVMPDRSRPPTQHQEQYDGVWMV